MIRNRVKESFEQVLSWPDDDQEKLARFVHEIEEWRAGDEVADEREVAKAAWADCIVGIELLEPLPICIGYGAPDDHAPHPLVRQTSRLSVTCVPRTLFAFGVFFCRDHVKSGAIRAMSGINQ